MGNQVAKVINQTKQLIKQVQINKDSTFGKLVKPYKSFDLFRTCSLNNIKQLSQTYEF